MIKITMTREHGETAIKWWVEGFEDREINDKDIEEVMNTIDTAKEDIFENMKKRQELEKEKRFNKLKLIKINKES